MRWSFIALGALTALPATAYDEQRAKNNLAHELANCAAYYMIAKEGFERGGVGTDQARAAVVVMDESIKLGVELSAKLTSEELAVSRVKLAIEENRRKMIGTMDNFSIIAAEFAFPCKDLIEAPDKRMKYWLEKDK
jgi:hypothetical protein